MNENYDENDAALTRKTNIITYVIIGIILVFAAIVCFKRFDLKNVKNQTLIDYEPMSPFTHMLEHNGTVAYAPHQYGMDNDGNVIPVCAVCGYEYDDNHGCHIECIPDNEMPERRHIQIDYDADGNELCRFYTDHNFDESGYCMCGAHGTPSVASPMTPPELQELINAEKAQMQATPDESTETGE